MRPRGSKHTVAAPPAGVNPSPFQRLLSAQDELATIAHTLAVLDYCYHDAALAELSISLKAILSSLRQVIESFAESDSKGLTNAKPSPTIGADIS